MKKLEAKYEPHLTLREFSLPPSGEWTPNLPGWCMIQVKAGAGYYLQAALNRELEPGTVLVLAEGARGNIRASQLGDLSLKGFNVIPARLTGLIALAEERFLKAAAMNKEFAMQVLLPQHRIALRMAELIARPDCTGLCGRLKLMELFVELFGNEFKNFIPAAAPRDARMRLQDFLDRTPLSELLELNFDELAQVTHCTPRHLSRIFQDEMGISFRDKRTELRLERARELLATTNAKVVDVALESGYKSLSLFNLMFARRYGASPARWRDRQVKS